MADFSVLLTKKGGGVVERTGGMAAFLFPYCQNDRLSNLAEQLIQLLLKV